MTSCACHLWGRLLAARRLAVLGACLAMGFGFSLACSASSALADYPGNAVCDASTIGWVVATNNGEQWECNYDNVFGIGYYWEPLNNPEDEEAESNSLLSVYNDGLLNIP